MITDEEEAHGMALLRQAMTLSIGLRRHHGRAVGRPVTSRMVTVTDPSSVRAAAGAVSHGRKRSGTSSPGTEVHSQQMNLALLSSGHGVGGYSGGSSAVLSAARVAAD